MKIAESERVDSQEILAVINGRIKAIYEKDEQGVLTKYAPNVVSFDLAPPLKSVGIDTIKKRLQNWFAIYQDHINQEVAEIEIEGCGDLAHSHCLTRTNGTSTQGEKMDMWYRTTTFYKNIDGKWLITHEHVSDPIDMETGKVIFDLQP
jgi:ketosteroid isomerase-like protein